MDYFISQLMADIDIRQNDKGEYYYWPQHDQKCWDSLNAMVDTPSRLMHHVAHKNVVVQAGGNAGMYVKKYAEQFRQVYTFEPDPFNFMCLCMNTVSNVNVLKFQACLGEKNGSTTLEFGIEDTGSIHVKGVDHEFSNTQYKVNNVPVLTIDNLHLSECDLIQLDIEGYEYFALLGASDTIDKFHPVICVENFWSEYYYKIPFEQVEKFLFDKGYSLVDSFDSDRVYKVV